MLGPPTCAGRALAVDSGLPTRHRGALVSSSWANPVPINVRPTDMGPDTEKGLELASAPLPLAGVAASGQAPAGGQAQGEPGQRVWGVGA